MTIEQKRDKFLSQNCHICSWQVDCRTFGMMQHEVPLPGLIKMEYFGNMKISIDTPCIKKRVASDEELDAIRNSIGRFDTKTKPLF